MNKTQTSTLPSTPLVYLVGAGPGDPGLLTLAGADALKRAHVVVYDYLANPELLKLANPDAELVYVGKSGVQHTKTQAEINQILVAKALSTKGIVVRLKGGDPYVFGRGGEEAEHLRAHNIAFQEIPGITAGIAAPAFAGIPVTHRDFTSSITLVTGHEREDTPQNARETPGEADGRVNYDALAKLDGTLVFYMGVKSLPAITSKLIAAGMPPETPAAVVRWGTRPNQQTVTGTIATIVEVVKAAGLTAPAITIVGKVVSLRETMNWFENRPLFGHKILVTRTRQQASELTSSLLALGAQVLEAPTISIEPPEEETWQLLDRNLMQIPAYDWVVFTSANGVRAAYNRLKHLGFDTRHFGASNVAAIGPATQDALEQIGIVPDLLPEKFVGEELALALKAEIGESEIAGKRFLMLRADIARPVLREELEKLGAVVDDLPIYRTVKPETLPPEVLTFLDSDPGKNAWVTFTSASTATNLWDLLTPAQRATIAKINRVSIGPITSAAMEKLGHGEWKPTHVATQHDIPGVAQTIANAVG